MWPQIKQLLSHIEDYPYDLFVTMTKEQPELIQDIKNFHSNSWVKVVENRGYDIGPFIEFLHNIDLQKYDLILKIHTKNNAPGSVTHIGPYIIGRELWAKLLIHSLLGTPQQFKKNIKLFAKNKSLGMIGSQYLISRKSTPNLQAAVKQAIEKCGYSSKSMPFIAGTMFMCRAHLLEPIKNKYQLTDFEPTDGKVRDGTLAHVMERLFGCIVVAQGYKIKGCDGICPQLFLQRIWRFIYTNKKTSSGYRLIKIFKLPIYKHKCNFTTQE
ncbi:MAG: hypothetical protein IJ660_00780 [Alphaproteobacteria bacterium]|nr:hypothetical protein [Alphaproteobacteria bacterium]